MDKSLDGEMEMKALICHIKHLRESFVPKVLCKKHTEVALHPLQVEGDLDLMAGGIGSVRYEEEFTTGFRGLRLFTCKWIPEKKDPKSLIFLCHGYGMECSISMRVTGTRLAKAGFAVYGIDYRGHGKSTGLQGYIPNFDDLVNDCSKYFTTVCEMPHNRNKMRYLLGESMGGAVVLLLHRKMPSFWHGAVLVAPMCKIAEEMKPHPLVIRTLTKLSSVIPKWKIVPTKDIIQSAFKSTDWREEIQHNPFCYKGKPRLQTAKELLMVSLDIEKNLDQVSLPFLVIHGGDDTVTDPSVSRALYETAMSKDKTFKLYPGMWHALTSAEPQQNLHLVFADIVSWLEERSTTISSPEGKPPLANRTTKLDKQVKRGASNARGH